MRLPVEEAEAAAGEETLADLRMPLLGVAAWAGSLLAIAGPIVAVSGWLVAAALTAARLPRRPRRALLTGVGCLLVASATLATALLRIQAAHSGPIAGWAAEGAVVDLSGTVVSDPRTVEGEFGRFVVTRVRADAATGRGRSYELGADVLVLGAESWSEVPLGARVQTSGRLDLADDPDLAALLPHARDPTVRAAPGPWWRGAEAVRASIRDAVAHRPEDQRALVPALVDGDDSELDPGLEEDFRTTGLTHLTAVSGTNLTLVVGFLLVLARWAGVRGRWLLLVGALGNRRLRAAGSHRAERGARRGDGHRGAPGHGTERAAAGPARAGGGGRGAAAGAAGLATSVGFALSVLATAGILVLARAVATPWLGWLPRWLAEAIAVPLAAQLACTPLVAAISGQVSLVAVAANLLVAPLVGPATVLGLAGGAGGPSRPGGSALRHPGRPGAVAWIIAVRAAQRGPPGGRGGLGHRGLVLLAGALAVLPGRWRPLSAAPAGHPGPGCAGHPGRRWSGCPAAGLGPRDDWVLAACDVGQGDGLVLNTGPSERILVDAGPDPELVDDCLDSLGIQSLPLVVLTHFHADHVDGLAGVLAGSPRRLGRGLPAARPHHRGRDGRGGHGGGRVASQPRRYGETGTLRRCHLQVLAAAPTRPRRPRRTSAPNDASVVCSRRGRGVRILMTGDEEPPGQERLARSPARTCDADVLKVPHHGSP